MSRYRRRALRFLWLLLVVALVVGVWQLSSLLRIDTFDVRATVKNPQPRIDQVITEDGTGNTSGTAPFTGNAGLGNVPQGIGIAGATPPNNGGSSEPAMVQIGGGGEKGTLLYINTDIDYGTVFPGESLTGFFTVHLVGTENVTYTVNITSGSMDMRPYLIVQKDPIEPDDELDATANGTSGDWYATGNLTYNSDTEDKWLVTFYVPDASGVYNADIYVETSDNITVNN